MFHGLHLVEADRTVAADGYVLIHKRPYAARVIYVRIIPVSVGADAHGAAVEGEFIHRLKVIRKWCRQVHRIIGYTLDGLHQCVICRLWVGERGVMHSSSYGIVAGYCKECPGDIC